MDSWREGETKGGEVVQLCVAPYLPKLGRRADSFGWARLGYGPQPGSTQYLHHTSMPDVITSLCHLAYGTPPPPGEKVIHC